MFSFYSTRHVGYMSIRKTSLLLASVSIVSLIALFLFLSSTNVFPQPIESIPVDGGWLGVFFILANGFFLSYILYQNKLGVTERLLLAIGLGFGLNFAVMIILGVLWEFSLLTVLAAHLVMFITLSGTAVLRGFRIKLGTFFLNKQIDFKITLRDILPLSLVAIIGALVILGLYKTLALPATEWDSLGYGLYYAKIIFEQGKIPLIAGPSIGLEMSASYPPGVQLTAVSMYTLAGNANDFYYRILSPIFSLATVLVTYKFARLLSKNRTFSLFAVAALCTVPYFWELFILETYLTALTFMITISAFFFFKAHNATPSDAQKYEIIGLLFCGFAALTSYIGLVSFGILVLYALQKKLAPKRFIELIVIGLAIVLPWYARNFILLGNPLYPFLGIGKYLDPFLRNSTLLHFQHYTLLPLHQLATTLSQIGACLTIIAVVYLTFSKRKNLFYAMAVYVLFLCLAIMAFHVAFPRYLIIATPILAVVFSTVFTLKPRMPKLSQVTAVGLMALIILSSVFMLPFTVKPQPEPGEDKWSYQARTFEEGDAWKWINENTPANARIATFDIKYYYIERDVMPLDGNESAPLYKMKTIEESIEFLQDRGVTHILSVPWASQPDNRVPPAYENCTLTKYLGTRYLPPLFIGVNGTAVYNVGPIDEETLCQTFAQKNMILPLKDITFNLTITNTTQPSMGKLYLPIPVDYRGGLMIATVTSCKAINVNLMRGIASTDDISRTWFGLCNNTVGFENSGFIWRTEKAGYYTVHIIDAENSPSNAFNVTVNLRFYNNLEPNLTSA